MSASQTTIASIYRYPVKGLSPERLEAADVEAGGTIPFDRAYAIENGPSGFDPSAPSHQPKIKFLMLMRNERLAALSTRYDDKTTLLTIEQSGRIVAEGELNTVAGRRLIERFFAGYSAGELRGSPRVLAAPGHSFSDSAGKYLSLINLASVRDLEARLGWPVHPLRFRANLYVEGLPAWAEFDLLGQQLAIAAGPVFRVNRRIVRCAATEVNPETAKRDVAVPAELRTHFGHGDCGVYLEVVEGGRIDTGAPLELAQ